MDPMARTLRSAVTWAFRNRETGRIVLYQPPNRLALTTTAAMTASALLGRRSGGAARAASAVGRVTGVLWSLGEVVGGVTPFRRAVGAVTLARLLRPAPH